MAAMFKKTVKRNFRKKNIDEDEANDEEEEPAAVIKDTVQDFRSKEKVKAKKKIDKTASSNSLLSFDDEIEDDGEVFKIRKSKESRRLAKKIEQEKKRKNNVEGTVNTQNDRERTDVVEEDADEKLAALRAELSQMAGDDDDDDDDDRDSIGSGSVKEKTTLGPALGSGSSDFNIPDAATIHAARKRREMARQTGEFIPLDDTQKYEGHFAATGRLVREDENDVSDDEEDGPIKFSVGRKGGFPALDRRRAVEIALSNQELEEKSEGEEEEDDEELKLWEDEQIRKGVSAPMVQAEQQQIADFTKSVFQQQDHREQHFDGQHLFPQVCQYSYAYDSTYFSAHANGHQSYGTTMPSLLSSAEHNVTIDMICDKMNQQLSTLQEVHRGHRLDKKKMSSQLETAQSSIKKLERQGRNAEQRFAFFQEMRGYVRDLIECLNNKVPLIDELEQSTHALLRNRANSLVQRRQMDASDQAEDFLNAQTGKQVKSYGQSLDQVKARRAAEREGRRARRRKHREKEKKADTHHEGQSTDDEETETDAVRFRAEAKRIATEEKILFEDVVEDFSSIDSIKSRFEQWKNNHEDCYANAYISLCLPKLFAPFVRVQLLDWNPFEAKCMEIEDFRWYKSLVLFGCGNDPYDIDMDDSDLKLIPTVLEKTVIPKLTVLFEDVWDPLSERQTEMALNLIRGMAEVYPNFHAQNKAAQSLFAAIVTRMRSCVSDNVFVPLYPRSLLDSKTSGALAFFQRQFWSCVKLLSNILKWEGLVSTARLQEMAIDGLLNRYLILALQHSHLHYDSLEKAKAITAAFPKQWFIRKQHTTLPSLEAFARCLASLAASMQRSSAGCPETEKKKARSGIRKVIQLLIQLRSVDKAKMVASEHNMEDMVKDV